MASYADARAAGGLWLLRIEDVDKPRCTREADQEIRRQLAVYGFEADGPAIRQSERHEQYEAALDKLGQVAHDGRLFACTCTRKLLDTALRNTCNTSSEVIYSGRCRDLDIACSASSTSLRLRVKDNDDAQIVFFDRAFGRLAQNVAAEVGDFILRRADGLYAYQLAVVVDDAEQGVTDVVRGADLLMNTPRQIYLQRRLGYATPGYLHLPLARNDAGEKLSKQTRAAAIADDNVIATLKLAWAFLRQPELEPIASVAHFWQQAFANWNPVLIRSMPHAAIAPANAT